MGYRQRMDTLWRTVCDDKKQAQAREDYCFTARNTLGAFFFNPGSDTDDNTGMVVVMLGRSNRFMSFARAVSLQTW